MTRSGLALLALLAGSTPVGAQLPAIFPPGSPIQDLWYPKIFWTSSNGFTFGGYYAIIATHSYETFDQPPPYRWGIVLNGQAAVSGSRQISLDAFAPLLADGWRFRLTLTAQRRNRADYFGIGNDAPFIEANADTQEFFYRARHVRHVARAEIQRRVVGGLRILAGVHGERWRLEPLAAGTQLDLDAAAGRDPTIGGTVDDRAVRVGVVFDTRDDMSAPRRGVFLEAVHAWGEADNLSYTRTYVSARAYLPLTDRVALTARIAGQRMGGTPRIGSWFVIESSDEPQHGIGGPGTHRGLFRDRLRGRHKLLSNVDVYFTVVEVPTLARLKLVAFVDAARVFEAPDLDFRITTDDLAVGGGAGFIVHLFRNAILGLTGGVGPDGFVLHSVTRWAY